MLNKHIAAFLITLSISTYPVFAQITTNTSALQASGKLQKVKEAAALKSLVTVAQEKNWQMVIKTRNGLATLVGIDYFGYPLYVSVSSADAASTIGTNQLWAGGSLGLSLSGSSNNLKNKMGIWDGGKIRPGHIELRNRILQKDNSSIAEDHSTHVAGIMIAAGVNSLARGMAFGYQQLLAYDYNDHISEMTNEAAAGLLLSNHSYTSVAGWNYNETEKRWEFYGKAGENEDYKFGYYSEEAKDWDQMAYNAPNYLIVKAAGNNRTQKGPAIGEPYFRFNATGSMTNAGNRPAGISSNDGYDVIPTYGSSKNILTVGAIQPFTSTYSVPADAVLSDFSNWGPTDDGRIKPDLVADGINILSSTASSDNSYGSMSGTSMASPSITGSALLLQEYFSQLNNGAFMRSATLKGLLIHTANEAGAFPGPDYQFGWGVANIAKAAEVIQGGNGNHLILQNELNGANPTFVRSVVASGNGPLVVTLCWTDPEGAVQDPPVLNSRTPKLVHDLDIRVTNNGSTYMPWVLNPNSPSAPATRDDNILDNVEKIEIANPVAGQTYTLTVSFKGSLKKPSQAYSLIVSQNYKEDFNKLAIDLSMNGLGSPIANSCPGSQLVTINIKNTGTTARSNIPVTTIISGTGNPPILTGTYTGTIEAGRQIAYTYATPFVAQPGATYTFTSTVNLPGDQNTANNQQVAAITIGTGSSAPTNLTAQLCGGRVRFRAVDNAQGPIFWYESPTATTPLATGYDTSTTLITPNNTYYAALNDVTLKAGLPNKSITNTGFYDEANNIVNMTALVPITIESIRLYVGNSGKVKFTIGKVINATQYFPVATKVIDVYATDPTPQSGRGNYEPSDVGAVFKVDLPLPERGDYFFIIESLDGATLFYNNGINPNPYPVTLSNVLSITGHNAFDRTNPSNTDFYKRFYIGIYDIGVKFFGCASERVPVVATICDEDAPFDVLVRPNPISSGTFRVEFDVLDKASLSISIYTTTGQRVYAETVPDFDRSFKEINPGNLSRGIYIVHIEHGDQKISKKLIVQ